MIARQGLSGRATRESTRARPSFRRDECDKTIILIINSRLFLHFLCIDCGSFVERNAMTRSRKSRLRPESYSGHLQKRTNRRNNICRSRPNKVAVNGRNAWILANTQDRRAERRESRPGNRRRRSPNGSLTNPDRKSADSCEVTLPEGRIGLKKEAAGN